MDPTLPFASEKSETQLEADYAPHYDAWKMEQTPQTRSNLLRAVDPVISKGLKTYAGPSYGSPTTRSRARRIALQSFSSYDPTKGSLQNHILSNMRRLQRVGAQEAQIIGLPERVAMNKKLLDDTEHELMYELGRAPSDTEIADRSGLSLKRIAYIRQANPVASSSQIEDNSEDASMPASTIPGDAQRANAWEEFIYYDLTPTEQLIYDMTLGRHGRKQASTREIADKLGITPGAVSQRAARIQQKLDEGYTQSVL